MRTWRSVPFARSCQGAGLTVRPNHDLLLVWQEESEESIVQDDAWVVISAFFNEKVRGSPGGEGGSGWCGGVG